WHGVEGQVTTFDFREKAPGSAFAEMFLDEKGKIRNRSNHEGALSTGVPGTVAGLFKAHQKLGRLPWNSLLEPAVRLARQGFPLTWSLHDDFRRMKNWWKRYPSSAEVFLKPNGDVYEPGENWKQPYLATTLQRIQREGAKGFYQGETARLIAQFMKDNNGLIRLNDLSSYRAIERVPVHGTFRGFDIYAMGPPSSGGVAIIEMLNILEPFDLKSMGHNSAEYLHLLVETMRKAFADRAAFLGDPDFNPDLPIELLGSKSYAEKFRQSLSLRSASKSRVSSITEPEESEQTTHFSVMDDQGNTVSLTFTLENSYGSKMVVQGAGFLLNNEMGDFNPVPGLTDQNGLIGTQPNRVAPGKRMLSSMTPTIVSHKGRAVMAIGSPGGRTIINTVLQVILNVLVFDMNIAEAVEAGRVHHQWFPDRIDLETRATSSDSLKILQNMGHAYRLRGSQGRAMGIWFDTKKKLFTGAADSRSPDGAAFGY
ncbi:MAG TPA: gamma-glutamyltransferase, partial [Verrucomicrobia bacterium]|nr:gamma-glutamyltransferase [Verrucomicrobiota bacterium]